MFEQGLLDPSGKRLMLEQGEIERDSEISPSMLDKLVASSVLRREPRNESVFYEISHDRLTETIARHRRVYLPGWVVPTLVGAVCVLAVVGGLLWHQVSLKEQANAATAQATEARDEAEYSLGQLLGETLVSRLREAGLSDALGQLLERSAPGSARDDHAPGLAGVLRLRHEGDIARDSATLAKARERYGDALAALAKLDALPGSNERKAMLSAERARIGSALGIVAFDGGQLELAQTHLDAALRDWQVVEAASSPRPLDLLDAADSHLARGRLFSRTGDYHRAEGEALAASRLALRVLKQAYKEAHGGRDASVLDASYDTGRAMQVFADAALNLHLMRPDRELANAAVLLAREAVRLRPQSFQAHKQLGTAIAARYSFTPPASGSEWKILLVEGRGLFDKLGADGGNLTMRRERAAIETLIGEIIADCIAKTTGCRNRPPTEEGDRSRIGVLESTGLFRWLASKDPGNSSWNSDVAWALRVQSKQLANIGDPAAITTLQRAIEWVARTPTAPRDVDARWQGATDLMQLAKLHAKAVRRTDARSDAMSAIEVALAQFDDAAGQSVGAQFAQINLFDQAVRLLKDLRMDRDAALLQERLDALSRPRDGPAGQSYAKAVALNQQAIDLTTKAEEKADAQSDSAWLRVEQLHADAVDEYPFDDVLWNNLRVASRRVAGPSDPGGPEHEMAMRRALIAGWMAKVLRPDNPQYLRSLYVARLELAVALINNGGSGIELQALVDRALMDAKEMARDQPASNDSRFHLADANLGVGYVREAQSTDGWDEAFRVALLHGDERAKRTPGTAEPHFWLAEQRRELAQRLERDQRADEAAEQRRRALQSCRSALALPAISGDERQRTQERQQAQACLKDLADSGVK
jgi:tetratricopeptide (TPR) repeat protein